MKLMRTEDAVGQVLCHDIDHQRRHKRCRIPQRPCHHRRRHSGTFKCRKRLYLYLGER